MMRVMARRKHGKALCFQLVDAAGSRPEAEKEWGQQIADTWQPLPSKVQHDTKEFLLSGRVASQNHTLLLGASF